MLQRASQSLEQKQQVSKNASIQDYLRDRDAFDAGEAAPPLQHVVIRSIGSVERIEIDDVIWISAAANYVEMHLHSRKPWDQNPACWDETPS